MTKREYKFSQIYQESRLCENKLTRKISVFTVPLNYQLTYAMKKSYNVVFLQRDNWMDITSHNVGIPALEIRKPDCSGYLLKCGRTMKGWARRYCVLKDACMYYYKNMNSQSAQGTCRALKFSNV